MSSDPKDKDWAIKNLEEASRNTRGIFYVYLGALVYCFLTVMGTSDKQIILGEKVQLPIVNIQVSQYGFFLLSPLLLILVFVYFQLYLQRMQGLKRQVRSQGGLEYRRDYPWMINIADNPEPGPVGWLQKLVVLMTLWWLMPVVLTVFYLWVLKRHEPMLSRFLFWESALGMGVVYFFWWSYRAEAWKWRVAFSFGLLILFFLPHAVMGPLWPKFWPLFSKEEFGPMSFDPRNLDLSYEKLIKEENEKYDQLPLADFRGVDLSRAKLVSAILRRADLRNAKLIHASMEQANLQKAWMFKVKLDSSDLSRASLDSAILTEASLNFADLRIASLNFVDLSWASLNFAKIFGASLESAGLRKASLISADLGFAWLKSADLDGSFLDSADLGGASLDSANLDHASLKSACLTGTSLRGTRISLDQLSETLGFYQAVLDDTLSRQIKAGSRLWHLWKDLPK